MNNVNVLKRQFVSVLQTMRAKESRKENYVSELKEINEVKIQLKNIGIRPMYNSANVWWLKESEV